MKVIKELPGLPLERALRAVSGRWKAVIIYVLLNGPRRTRELENQIQGISQKVLIEQLRALEEHGLVYRQSFPQEPNRVDYVLTEIGMSLKPLLSLLEEWGRGHAEELKETDKLLPCAAVVRTET